MPVYRTETQRWDALIEIASEWAVLSLESGVSEQDPDESVMTERSRDAK